MGTPDDEMWPGVTKLPDFKSTFPKWPQQNLASILKTIEPSGIELLQVSCYKCVWVCGWVYYECMHAHPFLFALLMLCCRIEKLCVTKVMLSDTSIMCF